MHRYSLPIAFAASLAFAAPVHAQNDLGDIVSGVARSLIAQELEQNAFREAQRVNTAASYRNFLRQYPNGTQRLAAEQALADLGGVAVPNPQPANPQTTAPQSPRPNTTASAASVEASIGLTRTERTQIQTQLSSLGYSSGVADGLWGANTRNAISRWQTANKLPATSYLTAQQVRLIDQQAGPVTDPVADSATGTADAAVEEQLLGLTLEERREIQRNLTRLGYSTGGVDGSFGANTRRALADWQSDEGVRATGYITADQLRELRRQIGT